MQSSQVDHERLQQAKREINTMTDQIKAMLAEKNDLERTSHVSPALSSLDY